MCWLNPRLLEVSSSMRLFNQYLEIHTAGLWTWLRINRNHLLDTLNYLWKGLTHFIFEFVHGNWNFDLILSYKSSLHSPASELPLHSWQLPRLYLKRLKSRKSLYLFTFRGFLQVELLRKIRHWRTQIVSFSSFQIKPISLKHSYVSSSFFLGMTMRSFIPLLFGAQTLPKIHSPVLFNKNFIHLTATASLIELWRIWFHRIGNVCYPLKPIICMILNITHILE